MDSCQQHNHKKCVNEALSKAEMICHDHNLALTPIREKVLRLLWEQGHTATKAYDLLDKFRKDEPTAKPITIYRALDFLRENHLVHKIESQNSYIGCEHPSRQHDCAFLICETCGTISECCDQNAALASIRTSINPKSFRIERVTLEIHGTCQDCF